MSMAALTAGMRGMSSGNCSKSATGFAARVFVPIGGEGAAVIEAESRGTYCRSWGLGRRGQGFGDRLLSRQSYRSHLVGCGDLREWRAF